MDMTLDREVLRRVSRAAFGQSHRLELMLEIAALEDGIFTMTQVSRSLGVTMSSLQNARDALLEVALISRLPLTDSRFQHLVRNDSAAWQWAQELADLARDTSNQLAQS
jgi:hypothetical protein